MQHASALETPSQEEKKESDSYERTISRKNSDDSLLMKPLTEFVIPGDIPDIESLLRDDNELLAEIFSDLQIPLPHSTEDSSANSETETSSSHQEGKIIDSSRESPCKNNNNSDDNDDDSIDQWCPDTSVAKEDEDALLDKHVAEDKFSDQEPQDTGRPIKSLVVVIICVCVVVVGAAKLLQRSSILSSWKGVAFSERSTPAKVAPAMPNNRGEQLQGRDGKQD